MSNFFQYIFCCCDWENNQTQRSNQRNSVTTQQIKQKEKPIQKLSRIRTKYKPQDTFIIEKQQRKNYATIYTCPICTLYFNNILGCSQCGNNVCRHCIQCYQKKFLFSVDSNMKCPFCNSETSNFDDYELEAKSYFDTTSKKGFLNSAQRKIIDEQIKQNQRNNQLIIQINKTKTLQNISEQQVVPTEREIQSSIHDILPSFQGIQNNKQAEQSLTNLRENNSLQNQQRLQYQTYP